MIYSEAPKFNNKENVSHIVNGKRVWLSRSIAVTMAILFYDKNQKDFYIPMGRRGKATPDEVGKFALPCGYLDNDESATEAAFRETWEEIGLNIEKFIHDNEDKLIYKSIDQPWYVDHSPDSGKQNVTMMFAVVFNWEDFEDLPVFTNKYNEVVGEVDEIKYFSFNDHLKNGSDKDFAFGHHNQVKDLIKIIN